GPLPGLLLADKDQRGWIGDSRQRSAVDDLKRVASRYSRHPGKVRRELLELFRQLVLVVVCVEAKARDQSFRVIQFRIHLLPEFSFRRIGLGRFRILPAFRGRGPQPLVLVAQRGQFVRLFSKRPDFAPQFQQFGAWRAGARSLGADDQVGKAFVLARQLVRLLNLPAQRFVFSAELFLRLMLEKQEHQRRDAEQRADSEWEFGSHARYLAFASRTGFIGPTHNNGCRSGTLRTISSSFGSC